ncbi:MAG: hypothetical protein JXX29_18430 [Deltaproteobacteria bacterium]|nr:hypothetical protein [Deltaproteobacteria bacterium]MBN2673663.1 hypothetical protein [Deltaproteobacteria bacterium]
MSDPNQTLAERIIKRIKDEAILPDDEADKLSKALAKGEVDWRFIFETQLDKENRL